MESYRSRDTATTSAEVSRTLRRIGPRRLITSATFIVFALILARYSWQTPLINGAERVLYGYPPDGHRVQDRSGIRASSWCSTMKRRWNGPAKRSPLDRGLLARAMANIDALQPKGSGGRHPSRPGAAPKDAELKKTLKSLRTPTFLAFATHRSSPLFIQPASGDVPARPDRRPRGNERSPGHGQSGDRSRRRGAPMADTVRRWSGTGFSSALHPGDPPIHQLCRRDRLSSATLRRPGHLRRLSDRPVRHARRPRCWAVRSRENTC